MSRRGPRFTEDKKLAIVKEGEKTGVKTVCAKYDISDQTYRDWRYKAQGIKPRKHFSLKKKLKILEEGARDGIYRTCAAYQIDPVTPSATPAASKSATAWLAPYGATTSSIRFESFSGFSNACITSRIDWKSPSIAVQATVTISFATWSARFEGAARPS